jgi:hypothetical protein
MTKPEKPSKTMNATLPPVVKNQAAISETVNNRGRLEKTRPEYSILAVDIWFLFFQISGCKNTFQFLFLKQ